MGKGGGGSSAPSIKLPKQPSLGKSYQQGINVQLKNLNRQLNREQKARNTYDPQRIQEQQDLQDKYGDKQYQQMLDALGKLDPQFMQARTQLGNSVMTDLDAGYGMTQDQQREVEQNVRGAQSARGNVYGGAPATAEAYAMGDRGVQLHQARLENVGKFLSTPSAVDQAQKIAPVSADRSFAYVNPNAGYLGAQFAQQNYSNQLGAAGLQAQSSASGGSSGAGWGSAISGIGSIIGTVLPLLFSDRRLKTDIKKVGKDAGTGLTKYQFSYKRPEPPKFEGVMAQDVEKKFPNAVVNTPHGKAVNYGALGMKMRRVG